MVLRNLGGPRGDLALVCRQLISLASVANNTFHLWLTTTINGNVIVPPDALQHLPPGVRDIFHLISLNDAVTLSGHTGKKATEQNSYAQ